MKLIFNLSLVVNVFTSSFKLCSLTIVNVFILYSDIDTLLKSFSKISIKPMCDAWNLKHCFCYSELNIQNVIFFPVVLNLDE